MKSLYQIPRIRINLYGEKSIWEDSMQSHGHEFLCAYVILGTWQRSCFSAMALLLSNAVFCLCGMAE